MNAHLIGDDPRQRRLAQSRRPVEKDMIQRIMTLFRRLDVDFQIFLHFCLPDIIIQILRTQGSFDLHVLLNQVCLDHSVTHFLLSPHQNINFSAAFRIPSTVLFSSTSTRFTAFVASEAE